MTRYWRLRVLYWSLAFLFGGLLALTLTGRL